MKMIVGLGNPGKRFEHTRHNIGFETLDLVAKEVGIDVRVSRFHALTGQGLYRGEKLLLVKPQTYMNLSGEAIGPLARYYGLTPQDIFVICDDVNLPLGQLRLRARGSAGGHNGLKNLITNFGSEDFPRLRLGVGPIPQEIDLVNFVLMKYTDSEERAVRDLSCAAADAVLTFLQGGLECAMNRYNQRIQHGEER